MTDIDDIVQETFDNFIKTKCKKIDNGKYECDSIDIVKVAPMTWKSVRKSDIDEFKLNYKCKKGTKNSDTNECDDTKSGKISKSDVSVKTEQDSSGKSYLTVGDITGKISGYKGTDLGYIKYTVQNGIAYISKIKVLKDVRRKGIATLLMKEFEGTVGKENKIDLSTNKIPSDVNAFFKSNPKWESILTGKSEEISEDDILASDNTYQGRMSAAQDLKNEMKEDKKRVSINGDGSITFYHGTSNNNADNILKEGKIFEGSFWSSTTGKMNAWEEGVKWYARERGKKDGSGGRVLALRIDPRDVSYSSGTQEIYAETELLRDEDGIWKNPKRVKSSVKLNYRCKKEEQQGEGPGSCGGKKSVPKEKVVSVKKPSVPKTSDASSIVHGIVNKSSKGDFDKLTKTLSDIDISELSELETKLDDELRNFDIETEGSKKYERLSAIYQVTRDVYKSRMGELRTAKKGEPVVHNDFEDIKGAINTLGSDVKILGKVSKSKTIATLNAISKERARIYNEYPLLRNLEISAYKIDDDSLNSKHAVAKFDGSDNTMSLLSDSASRGKMAWKSKGSNAKLYDYGIKKTYSETAQDFYRHEVGHAALQQLTTKEERSALYSTWGDRVKNEGFGSKSDTWNALERSVSSYAVKSEDEAFAEIFAKISGGEDVDSSIYPELINPIKRILTKGSKLNATVQDIFDQIMKLNYRCKKEEQVGEGPGSCGGKKSVPKEKMVSIKKPNVPKQTTPKAKRSTKSKPVAQKAPQDLDSILKMPGDTDTFYNAMEKHMSKLSANELIEISKKYERAMRAPGYEKIPYEEYSRMSLTYVTAKDMAKDAKLSKPKVQNVEIKSIDDAKKVLGVEDVWHDGNKPKASVIKSLNVIAKEHTRLLQDYPNLQRVNIKFMNFPDEGMERDGINGHYLMNSISMSSKLPMSERETRSLDGGVLMRGVGISGTYRHEFGHAVEDQLFTKEERDGISRLWNKLEDDDNKSGGFGSNSMKKQVGYTVSEYAIKNSMELVAEMFCEMAKGKTYPDTFCPEVQAPIKRVLFGGE